MKERIAALLAAHNYAQIQSNSKEIDLFFRNDNELAMVVVVLNARALVLSYDNYSQLMEQIRNMFMQKGYIRIRLFSLILVANPAAGRSIAVNDEFSWLVDATSLRLVIYENQMSDFDYLRAPLENLLAEEREKKFGDDKLTVWRGLGKLLWFSESPVTVALILINIIIFIWLSAYGSTMDAEYMIQNGAMYQPLVLEYGEVYRLFTCMFMHFGLQHLATNMISLYMFGSKVESALGKLKFAVLYILSGLLGNAASLLFHVMVGENVASAGASGAIFGVIGALLAIVVLDKERFKALTPTRVFFVVAYSILAGVTGSGIDNSAHIGGLVAGILLSCILYRKEN
ncbi:rhomboid protease GluP [Lachnospiraceae bacterium KH1T2]|nr:rhomboid protease GluP [Lachnospiraceae bacterium KH1T2]